MPDKYTVLNRFKNNNKTEKSKAWKLKERNEEYKVKQTSVRPKFPQLEKSLHPNKLAARISNENDTFGSKRLISFKNENFKIFVK